MPELIFATLDALPEELRAGATTTEDGKVKINVVEAGKLKEFRDNNIKIVKERDDLAALLGKAKEIIGNDDFEAAAKDIGDLRTVAQRVKDGQLVENKGLDEAVQERTKTMREGLEAQIRQHASEKDAWKTKFDQADGKRRRSVVDRSIAALGLDETIGMQPTAIMDIQERAARIFEVDDNDRMTPKKNGEVVYGSDGATPMSAKEWLTMLRDEAPHFFKGSNGGSAEGGAGAFRGKSATEIAKMDPMTRLRLANGEL
ncbi:hypothetical protein [Mesorhizobium sp. M8A.F.Ca.ET.021.01.1.1]|uniref:hypothetical protein n=1 Tax=Mesorhizobium sp. M8A.F.Ca.ET.021.01.1.1 TaxID=2496757 RepID=UPI000FCB1777|nr:hypothetical protein [Mesorhizobium sp. M8A.F.Ca.ET.021.01.1.1]RUW56728.1 hypothetical protein EOA36_02775 [Mesorhizobium sp. M8A.F.Ca.ET.021.01.1.1]